MSDSSIFQIKTTGSKLRFVEYASGVSPWHLSQEKLREAVSAKEILPVLDEDKWRIPLLEKLLITRQNMNYMGEEKEELTRIGDLINSVCIN